MKKLVIFSAILLLLNSCRKDITPEIFSEVDNGSATGVTVLQQRKASLGRIWEKNSTAIAKLNASYTPLDEYIGRGYKVGNTILGDQENASFPVIDLVKLKTKYATALISDRLDKTDMFSNAYSSFGKYAEQSNLTSKVKSGFSLNLGLFSIGRQTLQTNAFSATAASEAYSVFGEVGITFKKGKFALNTTSTITNFIASECLDNAFITALYDSSISSILDNYGPFVLTEYFTGGRASALYQGIMTTATAEQKKESELKNELNASFQWNKKANSTNGSLEFGNTKFVSSTADEKLSKLYTYIKTVGGKNNVATSPSKIESINLDLTAWMTSLDDENSHAMIDIGQNGLLGLSEVLLEQNFKQRIQDTHLGYLPSTTLREPFIEIQRVYVRNSGTEKLYDVCAVLNTRQGDKIVLSNSGNVTDDELRSNADPSVFNTKRDAILANKKQYYQCKITANTSTTINTILRIPLSVEMKGFAEGQVAKFQNPKTGIWYIYDTISKCAYSFNDDFYILDAYGIADWVDNIQEKPIAMNTLAQRYKIIGL